MCQGVIHSFSPLGPQCISALMPASRPSTLHDPLTNMSMSDSQGLSDKAFKSTYMDAKKGILSMKGQNLCVNAQQMWLVRQCFWMVHSECVMSKWSILRAPAKSFRSDEIKSRVIPVGGFGCWWGLNGLWKMPKKLGFPSNNGCDDDWGILKNLARISTVKVSSWNCLFPWDWRKINAKPPSAPTFSFFSSSTASGSGTGHFAAHFRALPFVFFGIAVGFLGGRQTEIEAHI